MTSLNQNRRFGIKKSKQIKQKRLPLCLAHLVAQWVQLPEKLEVELKKYDADKHGTSVLAAANAICTGCVG